MITEIVGVLVSSAICGLVGALVGRTRGREALGLLAGALLGPIGWLVILLAYPAPATPPARPRMQNGGFRTPEQAARDRAWEAARLEE